MVLVSVRTVPVRYRFQFGADYCFMMKEKYLVRGLILQLVPEKSLLEN